MEMTGRGRFQGMRSIRSLYAVIRVIDRIFGAPTKTFSCDAGDRPVAERGRRVRLENGYSQPPLAV
jgi:hypothetical protein